MFVSNWCIKLPETVWYISNRKMLHNSKMIASEGTSLSLITCCLATTTYSHSFQISSQFSSMKTVNTFIFSYFVTRNWKTTFYSDLLGEISIHYTIDQHLTIYYIQPTVTKHLFQNTQKKVFRNWNKQFYQIHPIRNKNYYIDLLSLWKSAYCSITKI